jgi:hypothetical protein
MNELYAFGFALFARDAAFRKPHIETSQAARSHQMLKRRLTLIIKVDFP